MQNLPLIASYFLRARWRWQFLRGAALERYQERRVLQSVQYALQHAPFYREHWAGYDPREWRGLPTVDKALMMQHFATFNTRGIACEEAMNVALQAEQSRNFQPVLQGLTVGLSSGTSGHRGLFLVSAHEQAAWAGTILARTLHDLRLRRLRIAFFLRSNSNLYEQVGGTLLQFRYFDLMQPLSEAVADLNLFQPDIIVGPPSLLGFLADAREARDLYCKPERLIAVAEVLEPQDKARLKRIFGVSVQQIYQCTEGLLAISCAHGSLHIQEDLALLQLEPLAGGEVAEGAPATPIVTDLWRRTQPIIRYRLNDVLRLSPTPCLCGSPFRVIAAIDGRCDDICYFYTDQGERRPFFPDTIRRMILLADERITDYQVTQREDGQLVIHIAVETVTDFNTVAEAVRESVAVTIAQYHCRPAILRIEAGLQVVLPGAKRRRVQRITHP